MEDLAKSIEMENDAFWTQRDLSLKNANLQSSGVTYGLLAVAHVIRWATMVHLQAMKGDGDEA